LTEYERGVAVERLIQHYFEFYNFYVIASRGSHGLADVNINFENSWWMVQAKLHVGLREPLKEQKLKELPTCEHTKKFVAWKYSVKRKPYIRFLNLITGDTFDIEPLTKEQEKEYQARKKAERRKKKMSTQ
jgi:methionine aminopeptidase